MIDRREWKWGLKSFGITDIDIDCDYHLVDGYHRSVAIAIVIATCGAGSGTRLNDLYAFEIAVEVIVGTSFPRGTFGAAYSGGRC